MQPIAIDATQIASWVSRLWWPSLRIAAFLATAPLTTGTVVPTRIKVVLCVALTALVAPLAHAPAELSIFSGAGVWAAIQEILIGAAVGMVVQLSFEALIMAGQTISMTMGLGFATMVDPLHGTQTAVIGQLFSVLATLTYLALNGHLILLGSLVDSFQSLPIGAANIDQNFLRSVAVWGAGIFETGLLIALPGVIALIIVTGALGVITRAAPQLNLFGIGFPITLLAGFFVLMVGMNGIMVGVSTLLQSALTEVIELVSPARMVH
jgi:flagellar biosynthetic protein FliR